MVYLLQMVIFYGYVSHNQMVDLMPLFLRHRVANFDGLTPIAISINQLV